MNGESEIAIYTHFVKGFRGGSDGKEFAGNAMQ